MADTKPPRKQWQPKRRFKLLSEKKTEIKLARTRMKHAYRKKMRLAGLSQTDRETYLRLTDPSNATMQALNFGGEEALQELHK